jgi:hypothetical protein
MFVYFVVSAKFHLLNFSGSLIIAVKLKGWEMLAQMLCCMRLKDLLSSGS